MDQERMKELEQKRFEEGLSHEEAHELGRLMAEKEGKPYTSHDDRPSPEEEPKAWEEVAAQVEEAGREPPATEERPSGEHEPEEERAVGTERQPVGPAGGGYAPPKGGTETPE